MTIEKAMQFIKGGFSFRLKQETGHLGEVWQRGFSEVRVGDMRSFVADSPGKFPYTALRTWRRERPRGLKPCSGSPFGTAKAVP